MQVETPILPIPSGMEYWQAHSVAECLSFEKFFGGGSGGDALYVKLWDFQAAAENPTPRGGDGTNGTCETPDAQYDTDNGDKARQWWPLLETDERKALTLAWDQEFPA